MYAVLISRAKSTFSSVLSKNTVYILYALLVDYAAFMVPKFSSQFHF